MLASSSNTQDGHLLYFPFSWLSSHVCHIVPSFADSLLNLGVLLLYTAQSLSSGVFRYTILIVNLDRRQSKSLKWRVTGTVGHGSPFEARRDCQS